jgi:hypothetical protein
MSHVDDELAEFEREIEELAQGGAAADPAQHDEVPAAVAAAESTTPRAAPSSHLFISSAHAYAPPQLNAPAAAVVAEPSKPAYQP